MPRIRSPSQTEKAVKHGKMTKHGHFAEIASRPSARAFSHNQDPKPTFERLARNGRTICPLLPQGRRVREGCKARASTTIAVLAILLGGTALSPAQPNLQGAVELSNGTKVPQNPVLQEDC
jgi:hypothetical protein